MAVHVRGARSDSRPSDISTRVTSIRNHRRSRGSRQGKLRVKILNGNSAWSSKQQPRIGNLRQLWPLVTFSTSKSNWPRSCRLLFSVKFWNGKRRTKSSKRKTKRRTTSPQLPRRNRLGQAKERHQERSRSVVKSGGKSSGKLIAKRTGWRKQRSNRNSNRQRPDSLSDAVGWFKESNTLFN